MHQFGSSRPTELSKKSEGLDKGVVQFGLQRRTGEKALAIIL